MNTQIPKKIRHRMSWKQQHATGYVMIFIGCAIIAAATNFFVGLGVLIVVIGNNIERYTVDLKDGWRGRQ